MLWLSSKIDFDLYGSPKCPTCNLIKCFWLIFVLEWVLDKLHYAGLVNNKLKKYNHCLCEWLTHITRKWHAQCPCLKWKLFKFTFAVAHLIIIYCFIGPLPWFHKQDVYLIAPLWSDSMVVIELVDESCHQTDDGDHIFECCSASK